MKVLVLVRTLIYSSVKSKIILRHKNFAKIVHCTRGLLKHHNRVKKDITIKIETMVVLFNLRYWLLYKQAIRKTLKMYVL